MKLARNTKGEKKGEGIRDTMGEEKRTREKWRRNQYWHFQIISFLVIPEYKHNDYWEMKRKEKAGIDSIIIFYLFGLHLDIGSINRKLFPQFWRARNLEVTSGLELLPRLSQEAACEENFSIEVLEKGWVWSYIDKALDKTYEPKVTCMNRPHCSLSKGRIGFFWLAWYN